MSDEITWHDLSVLGHGTLRLAVPPASDLLPGEAIRALDDDESFVRCTLRELLEEVLASEPDTLVLAFCRQDDLAQMKQLGHWVN